MGHDITQERCFSKQGLAFYLNKSTRWVDYQLSGPHPPPGFKCGKSWIFKKSEVDAWLERFRTKPALDVIVDEVMSELRAGK